MRILVLTSCTGQKAVTSHHALKLADFGHGEEHVVARERVLPSAPAEDLYTGQQHARLMRGVRAFRRKSPRAAAGSDGLDLHILSAGYGVVAAEQTLAPYEVTFQGMKKDALRAWADRIDVPRSVRDVLAAPYDLGLVLLGDAYLEAAALDDAVKLGGPTVLFCGSRAEERLPRLPDLHTVPLTNEDAKRFSCGLVGLKGDLAARLLARLAQDPGALEELLDDEADLKGVLEAWGNLLDGELEADPSDVDPHEMDAVEERGDESSVGGDGTAGGPVDFVVSLPQAWHDRPQKRLRYFIPEWDDLVDADYDFETDTHSGGIGDWSNQVFAHQMYPAPNYDGLLISKVVAEKSKKKKERINRLGVHRYLRVPPSFPIMGDCGAFGYIKEEHPPYTTDEILDYYTRLDFDYGVSIDHLIVKATSAKQRARYDLTIQNADEFLREHRARDLDWTPIGAVQGWSPETYADAAEKLAKMGYDYLGLGGLVRTKTKELVRIVQAVRERIPSETRLHLFGIARLAAMKTFADLGVTSVDSASALRRAWLGSNDNYWTLSGAQYAAIRIPESGKSFRSKRIVEEGRASQEEVEQLEAASLRAVRALGRGEASVETVLDTLDEFDHLITPDRASMREGYRGTLEDRPWERCPCAICQDSGIETVIFRGNNRNRRRGFHNTWVFYHLLQQTLDGEGLPELHKVRRANAAQLALF